MKKSLSIKYFAFDVLNQLGIKRPSKEQILLVDKLLTQVSIEHKLLFSTKLSKQEIRCLFYAAKGCTAAETAKLMDIKKQTVDGYRKNIIRKLNCHSIAHAVFEGIHYGYLAPIKSHNTFK